jgi:DNA-binding SARP family transcriptional activator
VASRDIDEAAMRETSLSVHLINGFDVGGASAAPCELPQNCRRVVAFLALWEQPVLRSFVSGTLWPDSDIAHANASLRSALWRLRTPAGAEPLVVANRSHVALGPNVQVDYRDALVWGRAVLAGASESLPSAWTLAEIAALSGDVLPDWYDEWVLLARERFRQLRLHALEALCEQLADAGRYGEALMAGLGAVAIEPLRESAHRHVIAVHLREDNVIEAIRQYRSYERLLEEELSLQPSVGLRALLSPVLPSAAAGA